MTELAATGAGPWTTILAIWGLWLLGLGLFLRWLLR